MTRVLIVCMPFASLRWPALGPSLLAAGLGRRGIGCDVAYLNFDFAERVGLDDYNWIADAFAFVLGGERLFAAHEFAGSLPGDDAYLQQVLQVADPGFGAKEAADYLRIGRHVGPFLDACDASLDPGRYDVIGFSCSFQQTVPSLALAARLRLRCPKTPIVFGGAACESVMGVELLRQFPQIDYVCVGEADRSLPELVETILAGRFDEPTPGVIGRHDLDQLAEETDRGRVPLLARKQCGQPEGTASPEAVAHGPPALRHHLSDAVAVAGDAADFRVANLDDLPEPAFDDYFARLRASPLADRIEPMLFFETARGCWWGEKHQCVFCGLNGSSLAFRSKTPARAIDELRSLSQRYGVHSACAADNIFDRRYFDTLLPMLVEANLDLSFAYEMKTNLTRSQVAALAAAGLRAAQLGVETLSTPLLRAIGKGATALDNLRALKWLAEAGIDAKWNLLYGLPNVEAHAAESESQSMAQLVPALAHLTPPVAVGRVRLDRFSPYFRSPGGFGIENARPHRAFSHVFPCDADSLTRLAYYHEFDFAEPREPERESAELLAAVATWREAHLSATLRAHTRENGRLWISDTRPCATAFSHRLSPLERAMYLACDAGATLDEIVAAADRSCTDCSTDPAAFVAAAIHRWLDSRLVALVDGRYLSLALVEPPQPTSARSSDLP